MTVACDDEFKTVDCLVASLFESRGVDAFCLAWPKSERQLRKLAAFLIYQSSQLGEKDKSALRKAFLNNKGITHTNTKGCLWRLTGMSAKSLIGERYQVLDRALLVSYRAREKLFHGQQTGERLARRELIARTEHIREWCQRLSDGAIGPFGYDGFAGSTSLFKVENGDLTQRVDQALAKRDGWAAFVASGL